MASGPVEVEQFEDDDWLSGDAVASFAAWMISAAILTGIIFLTLLVAILL